MNALYSTQQTDSPLQLNYYKRKNRLVVVTPADEDRFSMTVDEAIHACRAGIKNAAFRKQFKLLLDNLAEWLIINNSKIETAYLTVRDEGTLFLVIPKSKKYDRKFEDDLTDLDIKIAQDKNLTQIKTSVLTVPCNNYEAIKSFLNPQFTLEYHYGEQRKSS